MNKFSLKALSMVWGVIFCAILGVIVASGLVVMQWISYKFGLPLTDSGDAFSPSFWSDFFKIVAGAGAISFVILFREFWEDGISIDKQKKES